MQSLLCQMLPNLDRLLKFAKLEAVHAEIRLDCGDVYPQVDTGLAACS